MWKQYFYKLIGFSLIGVLLIAIITIILDPYFHFHKPFTEYRLYEERYINDGIARNFDYDSIIIGNSLSENYKTSTWDELTGLHTVKLPYSGAMFQELWSAIGRACARNKSLKSVYVSVDFDDIDRAYDFERYNNLPYYLYDDNYLNDINYVLNKDVIYRGTMYNVAVSLLGKSSTDFDSYSAWDRPKGPAQALSYTKEYFIANEEVCEKEYISSDREQVEANISINILPVIDANPDVDFILVVPPSSVAKWGAWNNSGDIKRRLGGLRTFCDMLMPYENVDIYAFDDEYRVTEDMSLFSDEQHFDASINDWMLHSVSRGEHKIDSQNVDEYIDKIYSHYTKYDYTYLNQWISID